MIGGKGGGGLFWKGTRESHKDKVAAAARGSPLRSLATSICGCATHHTAPRCSPAGSQCKSCFEEGPLTAAGRSPEAPQHPGGGGSIGAVPFRARNKGLGTRSSGQEICPAWTGDLFLPLRPQDPAEGNMTGPRLDSGEAGLGPPRSPPAPFPAPSLGSLQGF